MTDRNDIEAHVDETGHQVSYDVIISRLPLHIWDFEAMPMEGPPRCRRCGTMAEADGIDLNCDCPDGTYFDPTDHAANCEFSKPGVCIPAVKEVC